MCLWSRSLFFLFFFFFFPPTPAVHTSFRCFLCRVAIVRNTDRKIFSGFRSLLETLCRRRRMRAVHMIAGTEDVCISQLFSPTLTEGDASLAVTKRPTLAKRWYRLCNSLWHAGQSYLCEVHMLSPSGQWTLVYWTTNGLLYDKRITLISQSKVWRCLCALNFAEGVCPRVRDS